MGEILKLSMRGGGKKPITINIGKTSNLKNKRMPFYEFPKSKNEKNNYTRLNLINEKASFHLQI